jgi:peroxiredoxin
MSQQQRALEVGDIAPDFRLRHTIGTEVSLAETLERGPALVVFYVFDFGGY